MSNILIKCWGESIEKNGVATQKFLTYTVTKEDFSIIEKYCENGFQLNQFDYIEITLDQVSKKIILDLNSNVGNEKILETSWQKSIFYNIIADIEK